MGFPIAERWFEIEPIDDDITLITEPHVSPLIRCNIWHVRGADRDMVVDSGLGIASLREAAKQLTRAVTLITADVRTGGYVPTDTGSWRSALWFRPARKIGGVITAEAGDGVDYGPILEATVHPHWILAVNKLWPKLAPGIAKAIGKAVRGRS